ASRGRTADPVGAGSGARPRRPAGLLAGASRADPERGRADGGHHPRDGAADPPHARAPGPRALGWQALHAHPAGALPGLGLPRVARPLGGGPSAHAGARRADGRVVLGGHARPAGHRLRGAGPDPADHVDHARRRHPAARPRHLHGPGPAREPACRRAGRLPGVHAARAPHGAHDRRPRPPRGGPGPGPRRRLGARRPGARARAAVRRRPAAGRRRGRVRRAEPLGRGLPRLHGGAPRAAPAAAARDGGRDLDGRGALGAAGTGHPGARVL
ncbi:MAG: Pca regulon regulatory protein PcaR, partial [uncultured Solirubrobacteraceae bacterium]